MLDGITSLKGRGIVGRDRRGMGFDLGGGGLGMGGRC